MGRVELLFKAADEIAHAVYNNQLPMKEKVLDPCAVEIEEVSWPQSWFRYKNKVIMAEKAFGQEPLTDIQWQGVEAYLENQYGLKL